MNTIENGAVLLARVLMCLLFVTFGWLKLVGADATQAYFARYGLPLPVVAWIVAVVVELGGGLAILFGLLPGRRPSCWRSGASRQRSLGMPISRTSTRGSIS